MPVCCADPVVLAACRFGLAPAALAVCRLGFGLLAFAACCFGLELAAFRVFDGAAISVLLPAAATRGRAFLAVSSEFPELLPGRLQHALGFVLGAALLHVADKPRQALLLLGDVKPVDGLGEPQVGIDACDDDAGVDSQNLDANQRNSHVRVDDQPFVKDRVDDIGESRGRWVCALCLQARRHWLLPPRVPARRRAARCGCSSLLDRPERCWRPGGRRPRPDARALAASRTCRSLAAWPLGETSSPSSSVTWYSSSRSSSSRSSSRSPAYFSSTSSSSWSRPSASGSSSADAASLSSTTSPSWITPRQPSISSGWRMALVMRWRR